MGSQSLKYKHVSILCDRPRAPSHNSFNPHGNLVSWIEFFLQKRKKESKVKQSSEGSQVAVELGSFAWNTVLAVATPHPNILILCSLQMLQSTPSHLATFLGITWDSDFKLALSCVLSTTCPSIQSQLQIYPAWRKTTPGLTASCLPS